mmetsp:Transcript_56591/g.106633  ORF Transcript_56591/g.106633 Transcript_56591/m.106633 type:complete len:312 (+) Transcript_56591:70-1005(+)
MPGIADLILSTEDSVDDDLSLEDPALARELEELRAQRRPDSAAATSLPSQAKPATGAPEASNASGGPNAARTDLPPKAKGRTGSSQGARRSLADQILSNSSGNDELDLEVEAMEQQLQQQLSEYKKQCQSPAGGAAAQAAPRAATALAEPGSAQPTRDPPAAEESDAAGAQEPPELKDLRSQAAQLEEVFPESGDAEKKLVELRPRRQIHARATEREKNRSEAPSDPEMLSLRNALENLDLKLRAVQKHSALQDPLQRQPVDGSNAGARVIAELQAQNAHLRERFKANGKERLLHLDHSLFGAEVAVKPTT